MSRKLAVILLAAFALAAYWSGLRSPFVWDDDIAITTNQSIHQIADSLNPPAETPVAARPLVNLSLALNYAFGELDPVGYHVFNLAVLVASALLLFGIVRTTMARQLKGAAESSLTAIALPAALLWVVHPLLSETVYYTTQRTESLMGMFYLLTLYAATRALRQGRRRAILSGSPKWTALAILACAAGMATKESMVTAPIAVILRPDLRVPSAGGLGGGAACISVSRDVARSLPSTSGCDRPSWASVGPLTYLFNQAQMITAATVDGVAAVLVVTTACPSATTDVVLPGALVRCLALRSSR
jgi:hypothetical protein